MLPSFLIIGAMKSGTTSLYEYLASHPDTVTPSTKKEPHYFRSDEDFSKGMDWYGGLFKGNGTKAFEASTIYTRRHLWTNVPARIKSAIPHAQMIYLMRDPVDRAYSHYVHLYAKRLEEAPFAEAIRARPDYVDTGRYFYQLQAYLDHFPRNQIHLLTLEDLRKDPRAALSRISSFLGITDDFDDAVLTKRFNPGADSRPTDREIRLRNAAPHPKLASLVTRTMRRFRPEFERPVMTPEDERYLMDQLRPDVESLRELTGLSFTDWRDY